MFKRRTLFIVGAGASAEVHLPAGAKLARTIGERLDVRFSNSGSTGDQLLFEQFRARYQHKINEYQQAGWLIRNGVLLTHSIDDFLDLHSQNELVQEVGKAAIVKSILEAEENSLLYYDPSSARNRLAVDRIESTWYVKFMRTLVRGVSKADVRQIFANISFVIFNYDRCVEFFLLNALQRVYSIPPEGAASIVGDLHIIHPYGTVAELPNFDPRNGVPYGGDKHVTFDYLTLASRIKTYTEQTAGDNAEIQDEVRKAECIVFLGFGFHAQNMSLIKPAETLERRPVFCTAFGFSDNDSNVIQSRVEYMFRGRGPTELNLPSWVIIDKEATCAKLFDDYAKSITAD